ncbi:hypothetical protein RvY_15285-2 [Ramazzottius varieornatus]|uniref:Neurotransmitter-gated ion-channel transmembrane domain-containing protein n=1 Tax=Ramazzottius varieornatus TaxID=947166 RepID=A0A1D1VUD3_RAMVA|nr:hypothetical protein RvY_15285-2 [Ramazzottius varieornatus]
MVFRSVTYNADEVDIDLKEPKMELKDYCEQPSGTWDLAEVPLFKMYRLEWRRHGRVRTVFVQLDMKVARKSQFYVVTFLLPCVCIAFLTIFVFYLPAAAGEKICIGISILFTIVVFLLILTDILPPSDSLPLMTKFLVFTFVCNLTSVFITVITINWHYRTPEVYEMGSWTKLLWMEFLPRLLLMRRPVQKTKPKLFQPPSTQVSLTDSPNGTSHTPHPALLRRSKWSSRLSRTNSRKLTSQSSFEKMLPASDRSSPIFSRVVSFSSPYRNTSALRKHDSQEAMLWRELTQLGQFLADFPGYKEALHSVAFIAKSREEEFEEEDVSDVSVLFPVLTVYTGFSEGSKYAYIIDLNRRRSVAHS